MTEQMTFNELPRSTFLIRNETIRKQGKEPTWVWDDDLGYAVPNKRLHEMTESEWLATQAAANA